MLLLLYVVQLLHLPAILKNHRENVGCRNAELLRMDAIKGLL